MQNVSRESCARRHNKSGCGARSVGRGVTAPPPDKIRMNEGNFSR